MELLENLKSEGFEVNLLEGNRLAVRPGSRLTPEIASAIRKEKPSLILALKKVGMDEYLNRAIARLNMAYRMGDPIRPHTEKSLELESVITTSFLSCDVGTFKTAVDEWEAFFLNL